MYVIEDDPYSDLRFTGEALPPIKYFDKGDRVILVCSFSKVLSPGMRLALMIPPAELYDALYYIKSYTDLHTPSLTQLVAAEFLNRGLLDGQIEKVIAMYKDRWEKMERAMREYFPSELKWVDTKGGIFTWLKLPIPSKDCDSIKMLGDCLDSCGVAYMPTASFYINPEDGNNTIRLNFTSAPYERIEEGIEKLGGFLKSEIAKH